MRNLTSLKVETQFKVTAAAAAAAVVVWQQSGNFRVQLIG